jgi:hypothetical protein
MVSKFQMMLDAKTIGVLTRNIAAMPVIDEGTKANIEFVKQSILKRYGANSPLAAMLMINFRLPRD